MQPAYNFMRDQGEYSFNATARKWRPLRAPRRRYYAQGYMQTCLGLLNVQKGLLAVSIAFPADRAQRRPRRSIGRHRRRRHWLQGQGCRATLVHAAGVFAPSDRRQPLHEKAYMAQWWKRPHAAMRPCQTRGTADSMTGEMKHAMNSPRGCQMAVKRNVIKPIGRMEGCLRSLGVCDARCAGSARRRRSGTDDANTGRAGQGRAADNNEFQGELNLWP